MGGFTVWGAFSTCALLLFAVAMLQRVVAREPDRIIRRVLVVGFVAKGVMSAVRYWTIFHVYGGGDAGRYLREGSALAPDIRVFLIPETAFDTGTRSMEFLTGVVFAILQPHVFVGFLVFALLAFTGQVLSLRGFQLAFPEGDDRRYAVIVLLVPTMLFWPSSLGKDAWLVFSLGVGTYGVARLLRRLPFGYALAAAGVAGAFLVRPHMGALLAVAAAAGFLVRFRDADLRRGAVAWLVGVTLIGVGTGFVLVNFADRLLPRDEVATTVADDVDALFAKTEERTATGGSEFQAQPVDSLGDVPRAFATVPFRPFPWEADGLLPRLTSLEGLALLGLLVLSFTRLLQLPRLILRRPFVAFAAAYTTGFVVAFSTVGNFGILARQRSQFIPLFAVLLALPAVGAAARRGTPDVEESETQRGRAGTPTTVVPGSTSAVTTAPAPTTASRPMVSP